MGSRALVARCRLFLSCGQGKQPGRSDRIYFRSSTAAFPPLCHPLPLDIIVAATAIAMHIPLFFKIIGSTTSPSLSCGSRFGTGLPRLPLVIRPFAIGQPHGLSPALSADHSSPRHRLRISTIYAPVIMPRPRLFNASHLRHPTPPRRRRFKIKRGHRPHPITIHLLAFPEIQSSPFALRTIMFAYRALHLRFTHRV